MEEAVKVGGDNEALVADVSYHDIHHGDEVHAEAESPPRREGRDGCVNWDRHDQCDIVKDCVLYKACTAVQEDVADCAQPATSSVKLGRHDQCDIAKECVLYNDCTAVQGDMADCNQHATSSKCDDYIAAYVACDRGGEAPTGHAHHTRVNKAGTRGTRPPRGKQRDGLADCVDTSDGVEKGGGATASHSPPMNTDCCALTVAFCSLCCDPSSADPLGSEPNPNPGEGWGGRGPGGLDDTQAALGGGAGG